MGISLIAAWFSSKQSNILAREIKENINNV
jgi:hypothetical protein